jgi:hypothetical protein
VAPWTLGDCVSIGIGVICIAALVLAPFMTGLTLQEVLAKLGTELHPWP